MSHNDESLKPCPFCGSKDVRQSTGDPVRLRWQYIECTNCGASSKHSAYMYRAVAAWNRRAEQPQPAPMQVDDEIKRLHLKLAAVRAALASRAEHAVLEWTVIADDCGYKRLTDKKTKWVVEQYGYKVEGYILRRETQICLSYGSAIRWMTCDELFKVMHAIELAPTSNTGE